VAEFAWDVFLPGEDLPHRLTTDYLVQEGESITVDGREWLAEQVEVDEEMAATGIVRVVAPEGPLAPTDPPA
jgi:hypothetical protein